MSSAVVTLIISIIAVGILVFVAILITQKRGHAFDVMEYQTDFLAIENSLRRENPASYNMAIVKADKLLDKALCEMGTPGKTMGDRLKRTGTKFTELNKVWYAHKLRNQIAHEYNFEADYNQARHALNTYKQALKDLGAI